MDKFLITDYTDVRNESDPVLKICYGIVELLEFLNLNKDRKITVSKIECLLDWS